ncbi:hypothetical protein GCM10027597_17100 [Saccharopolyspora tripterygii]
MWIGLLWELLLWITLWISGLRLRMTRLLGVCLLLRIALWRRVARLLARLLGLAVRRLRGSHGD